jgi:hypothetical protein
MIFIIILVIVEQTYKIKLCEMYIKPNTLHIT